MNIEDDPVRIDKGERFKAIVRTCGVNGQHIIVRAFCPSQGFDIFALEGFPEDRKIALSPESYQEERGVLLDVVAEWNCRFDDDPAVAVVISYRDF
jgi:hypothetical protein